jgi:hypothetical protein
MQLHHWNDWAVIIVGTGIIWFLAGCAVVRFVIWSADRRDEGDDL